MEKCPGAANLKTPTLTVKECPECNCEVEIFSDDIEVKCNKCGFVIYNEIESCIKWCKYAEKCLGEKLYKKTE